jgi:hypothetical protein
MGLAQVTASTSGIVTVEKENARITLSNFRFSSDNSNVPLPAGQAITRTVNVFTQQGETQQIVRMEIGLYNKNDNVNSLVFNPNSDCNFNDPAVNQNGEKQVKTYEFIVRSSSSVQDALKPQVTAITFDPPSPLTPFGTSKVTARISKHSSVSLGEVYLSVGDMPIYKTMSPLPGSDTSATYEATLSAQEIGYGGQYTANVIANYRLSGQESSLSTASFSQTFTVLCNDAPRGQCYVSNSNTQQGAIATPQLPCFGGMICRS